MSKTYNSQEVVTAIIKAIRELDANAFKRPIVRDAFRSHQRCRTAYLLLEYIRRDPRLGAWARWEPNNTALDWARIAYMASKVVFTVDERVGYLIRAIRSQDPLDFGDFAVREAFSGWAGHETAYRMTRIIASDKEFAALARSDLVRSHIDWARTELLAAKFLARRERRAVAPTTADLSGVDLYMNPWVLGPRFRWAARAVGQKLIEMATLGGTPAVPARVPAAIGRETKLFMYHVCQACPSLPEYLAKFLPASIFNLDEIRPAYEERRRRDLGLFAATLS